MSHLQQHSARPMGQQKISDLLQKYRVTAQLQGPPERTGMESSSPFSYAAAVHHIPSIASQTLDDARSLSLPETSPSTYMKSVFSANDGLSLGPEKEKKPLDPVIKARKALMRELGKHGPCEFDCRHRKVKCRLSHHSKALEDILNESRLSYDKENVEWAMGFDDQKQHIADDRDNTIISPDFHVEVVDRMIASISTTAGSYAQQLDDPDDDPYETATPVYYDTWMSPRMALIGHRVRHHNDPADGPTYMCLFVLPTFEAKCMYSCASPSDLVEHYSEHSHISRLSNPLRLICSNCGTSHAALRDSCSNPNCGGVLLLEWVYAEEAELPKNDLENEGSARKPWNSQSHTSHTPHTNGFPGNWEQGPGLGGTSGNRNGDDSFYGNRYYQAGHTIEMGNHQLGLSYQDQPSSGYLEYNFLGQRMISCLCVKWQEIKHSIRFKIKSWCKSGHRHKTSGLLLVSAVVLLCIFAKHLMELNMQPHLHYPILGVMIAGSAFTLLGVALRSSYLKKFTMGLMVRYTVEEGTLQGLLPFVQAWSLIRCSSVLPGFQRNLETHGHIA